MQNQPTPQEEFQIAQQAFKQKDFKHAMFHLGWALASNAEEKRYLDLLHKIIKQTRNPLDLIPVSNSMSYAEIAIRAYIAAQQRDLEHALYLIFQVFEAVPTAPYFPWLVSWLSNSRDLDAISRQSIWVQLLSFTKDDFTQFTDDFRGFYAEKAMETYRNRAFTTNIRSEIAPGKNERLHPIHMGIFREIQSST